VSGLAGVRAALAPLLVAALLLGAGDAALSRRRLRGERRLVGAALAGLLLLHALLTVEQIAGVRWSMASILVPLVGWAVAGGWFARRRRGPPIEALDERARGGVAAWGDLIALAVVLVFAGLAWTRWISTPDFAYHWGLKAHRYAIVGGIDYRYLGRPWNWPLHPDYPSLWPELMASVALVAGAWHEPSLLATTPLLVGALLLVAVRGALRAAPLPPWAAAAALGTVALASAAFGIGYVMAGAADWLPALALTAAVGALLTPAGAGDVEIGLSAAVAAASKIEGIPLGAFLVLVQLARHARARRRPRIGGLLALVLPPALVVAHWAASVHRHHLFQADNAAAPDLHRLVAAAPALWQSMMLPAWHAFPLLLLLLPLLFVVPRLRPVATVLALQLAFYLSTYVLTPVDPAVLAINSFPRLVLQVLPATMTALAIAAFGTTARTPTDGPPRS